MKKLIYIFIIIALGLASCEKDYLELSDPNTLSPSVFPTTMEHMDLLLTSVYANTHSYGLYGHNFGGKNVFCFDHTWDLAWRADQHWNELTQNNAKSSDSYLYETWRDIWRGVQQANNFLGVAPDFKAKYANADDLEALKFMEGQAHFLRAWYYFYLVNFWGETFINNGQGGDKMGVPIISNVADSRDEMYVTRESVREVWDFIIADLKEAETLLEGKVWTGADKSRVNEWAVKGFLGRAYLYTEEWDNAKTALKDVIDNSGRTLVAFDTYKEMFNGKNELNEESLFEISLGVDKNTWGAWGASIGSGVAMVIAPCFMNDGAGAEGSGWSNGYVHDKNLERFGFNLPMYNYVDNPSFDTANAVGIDNQKTICDPAYIAQSINLRNTKAVDPRLWIGCLQPYVDSMIANGKRRAIVHYKDAPVDERAWSLRKFVNLDENEYYLNVNNGSNFYWLRLADVYLMYAEVAAKTNDNVTALEYINKVKRRAYGYPVDSPSPVDYSGLTAMTMASDPVLKNDPLKYERYVELFGEGFWWFDVCRWKIGDQEASYYQTASGGAINWRSASYAQPIPQLEMETNHNMVQNPL